MVSPADPLMAQNEPVDGPPGEGGPVATLPVGLAGPAAHADLLRRRADALRARRIPFAQATVVRAIRPTSAKAGDRALVLPDGTIEGFVGGACAESSVRLHGLRVLRDREPVVLRIIPGAAAGGARREGEDAGGNGPGGEDLGLRGHGDERRASGARAGEGRAGGPAGQEVAVGGLVTVSNPCASGGMLEIFLEGVFPPPLVQVFGDAPIARALRSVGESLGYEIRRAGAHGEMLAPDSAAVVVASHGRDEEPLLTAALRAGVPYVGLVASRRRGAQVAAALDVPTWDRQRLRTPAGLDIGARTPEEIALSIFAEIIAERAHAPASARSADLATAVPPGPAAPQAEPPGPAAPQAEPAESRAVAGAEPLAERAAAPGTMTETADPVCGMIVAVTGTTPHLSHDGRMWYFCGPGCRQAFADDPARYSA